MQEYIRVYGKKFEVTGGILKRPDNTTAYSQGKLINSGPVLACNTVLNSPVVAPASVIGIVAGMSVSGTGIPASTLVLSVGTSTITLDKNATANGTGVTLTFTANSLPFLDFSAIGGGGMQFIDINSLILCSSNGSVTTPIAPQIAFYNYGLPQASVVDAVAWAPGLTNHALYKCGRFVGYMEPLRMGSGLYEVVAHKELVTCKLDSNARLYYAILDNSEYIPGTSENLLLTVKGMFH